MVFKCDSKVRCGLDQLDEDTSVTFLLQKVKVAVKKGLCEIFS